MLWLHGITWCPEIFQNIAINIDHFSKTNQNMVSSAAFSLSFCMLDCCICWIATHMATDNKLPTYLIQQDGVMWNWIIFSCNPEKVLVQQILEEIQLYCLGMWTGKISIFSNIPNMELFRNPDFFSIWRYLGLGGSGFFEAETPYLQCSCWVMSSNSLPNFKKKNWTGSANLWFSKEDVPILH